MVKVKRSAHVRGRAFDAGGLLQLRTLCLSLQLIYTQLLQMPSDQATPAGMETKPRGANRSTKVAGKLKVLPEQPEPATSKPARLQGPPRDQDDNVGTTGDSEDGDIDDDDEGDPDDVEVSIAIWLIMTHRH